VVDVVQADPEDLPRPGDRRADALAVDVDRREVPLDHALQLLDAAALEEGAVIVGDVRRQVDDLAVREQHRGLFLAGFADTQQFHPFLRRAGDYSKGGSRFRGAPPGVSETPGGPGGLRIR
jgi:hypothetical protein